MHFALGGCDYEWRVEDNVVSVFSKRMGRQMWQRLLGKRAGHPRPCLQAACMQLKMHATFLCRHQSWCFVFVFSCANLISNHKHFDSCVIHEDPEKDPKIDDNNNVCEQTMQCLQFIQCLLVCRIPSEYMNKSLMAF